MSINVDELATSMLAAAKAVFDSDWPMVKEYAEVELRGIADGVVMIEKYRLEERISQKQAKTLIKMKKNTAQIVLLTIEGIGIIAVEKAINAALKVVKDTINTSIGFNLI